MSSFILKQVKNFSEFFHGETDENTTQSFTRLGSFVFTKIPAVEGCTQTPGSVSGTALQLELVDTTQGA